MEIARLRTFYKTALHKRAIGLAEECHDHIIKSLYTCIFMI